MNQGLGASEAHIGQVGALAALVTGSFTRPANTTQYASGDLVANSATAGSVVPITLAIGRGDGGAAKTGMIRRLRLRKSGTSITNASFRIHLYRTSSITTANGDNGAFSTDQAANYVGKVDIVMDQAFTDGASGNGVPTVGSEFNFASANYYALIEARAAYTPADSETFTLEAEVIQN